MPNEIAVKNAAARARVAKQAQAKPRFTPYEHLRTHYGEMRSRTQLRRAIQDGLYPIPRQLSAARIGWVTAELDDYYDACPAVDYAPKKGRAA